MLGGTFLRGHFPSLSTDHWTRLTAPYSIEDTRTALMSMGSFKAPGPDGFQPLFFNRSWEVTGAVS